MISTLQTFVVRSGDLEETGLLIGSLFGVEMRFKASEVWDDYYLSDRSQKPYFILKKNYNVYEEPEPLALSAYPDYDYFLEVVDHPDPDAVENALVHHPSLEALEISRRENGELVFKRKS